MCASISDVPNLQKTRLKKLLSTLGKEERQTLLGYVSTIYALNEGVRNVRSLLQVGSEMIRPTMWDSSLMYLLTAASKELISTRSKIENQLSQLSDALMSDGNG